MSTVTWAEIERRYGTQGLSLARFIGMENGCQYNPGECLRLLESRIAGEPKPDDWETSNTAAMIEAVRRKAGE